MNGHLIEGAEQLRTINWADAQLERIEIDYESVELLIQESSGRRIEVSCLGYIGYEAIGFWDETIIESAALIEDDALIARCILEIGNRAGGKLLETGCAYRNKRKFNVLHITFIDGHALKIVVAGIVVT
jgi:hypothetical protein